MKNLIITSLSVLTIIISVPSMASSEKVYNDQLEIEGEIQNEIIKDPEYRAYQEEFNKVKNMHDGFRAKKKILKNLKKYASKLADEHREFLEERNEYEKEIDKFNNQIKCIQSPNARDCRGANSYPSQVQNIISGHYPSLKNCFQKSVKKGKNSVNGFAHALIKIGAEGRVKSVGWKKEDSMNSNTFKCMNSIIAKINFPATPNQKSVLIKQPFNFRVIQ